MFIAKKPDSHMTLNIGNDLKQMESLKMNSIKSGLIIFSNHTHAHAYQFDDKFVSSNKFRIHKLRLKRDNWFSMYVEE